ncbi:MAG TPA: NAD-dependent epimerase/dehydratase family protein [Longimicrobium sp.]|jgi:nucleoside-diphosphate-sugar epimerase
MKVFLTGATGHIGGAVAEELIRAGHTVTALVRNADSAARVAALGASPLVADLREPESYRAAATEADVLVHTAFEYNRDGSEVHSTDRAAVAAMLQAARESGAERRVIYTSSAYLLGGLPGPVDEDVDTAGAPASSQWRLAVERDVLGAGGAVVRPGLVYGGRGGTMPYLFGPAVEHGAVEYQGDGRNRWTLVYQRDLAALYLKIAERGASGIFHGVDGAPLTVREVAEAASRAAGAQGRTRAIPHAEGDEHAERALSRDVAVIARRSLELGWAPTFPSFLEGADQAFAEWSHP